MKKRCHAKRGPIWKTYQFFDEETIYKVVLQYRNPTSNLELEFGKKTFELLHKLKTLTSSTY